MQFVKTRISWAIMMVLAVLLIVMGLEGSLGKVLGCILTPAEIVLND